MRTKGAARLRSCWPHFSGGPKWRGFYALTERTGTPATVGDSRLAFSATWAGWSLKSATLFGLPVPAGHFNLVGSNSSKLASACLPRVTRTTCLSGSPKATGSSGNGVGYRFLRARTTQAHLSLSGPPKCLGACSGILYSPGSQTAATTDGLIADYMSQKKSSCSFPLRPFPL
jgi:hypothetical protein